MEQAPGFVKGGRAMVYKLNKIIYGCRQSGALFHKMVRKSLLSVGKSLGVSVVQSEADKCLFIFRDGADWVKVLCHVDDFFCTYSSRDLYDRIFVRDRFRITDYGVVTKFVGMCVERTQQGYYRIHQKPY